MEVYIKGLLPSGRALHSDSAHSKRIKRERVRRKDLEKRRRLKKDKSNPYYLAEHENIPHLRRSVGQDFGT